MAWIDDWLPDWHFEEVEQIHSHATPAALLDAAAGWQPGADPLLNAALALRNAPARLRRTPKPAQAAAPGAAARFSLSQLTLLGRHRDRALAYGVAGRFWEPGGGLLPLADAQAFRAFEVPDAVRLVLAFEVVPDGGQQRLTALTRAHCGSEATRQRLAAWWLLARPASLLLRRRILAEVQRTAEAAAPPGRAPNAPG